MSATLERDSPETVSAFAAKTHLSRLLRSVEMGEQFLITRRGKPVARLVPADAGPNRPALHRLVHEYRAFRTETQRSAGASVNVRELRDAGRRS
jgi:prevent-host-death family protein